MKTSRAPLPSPIIGAVACLALAGVLAVSCETAPAAPPAAVAPLDSVYLAGSARGDIAQAIVLADETAETVLKYLNPSMLGTVMNVKPLDEAGFFPALEAAKKIFVGIKQVRLQYWSIDAAGRPARQSGMLYLPAVRPGARLELPVALVCHGTQTLRDRVPSRLLGGERNIALLLAASGCACVLPDYPGLGDSGGFHPYCHATSLAHASVDALRAARNFLRTTSAAASYSGFTAAWVAGYSEGGYAAMATLRELETEASGEFPLRAAWPMAGPFDMARIMRGAMTGGDPVASPYYLPYIVLGWQQVYGAEMDPAEAFKPEYLRALAPLFDGRTTGGVVNAAIAKVQGVETGKVVAVAMLKPDFAADLLGSGSPRSERLLAILRENDLYSWKADPAVPVHFMAAPPDELVPFANSEEAFRAFKAAGIPCDFRSLAQTSHERGAYEAFFIFLMQLWGELGLL